MARCEGPIHTPVACPCGRDHSRVGDRVFVDSEGRKRFPGYELCSRCGAWTNMLGPGGHDDSFHPASGEVDRYALLRDRPHYHPPGCPCGAERPSYDP